MKIIRRDYLQHLNYQNTIMDIGENRVKLRLELKETYH